MRTTSASQTHWSRWKMIRTCLWPSQSDRAAPSAAAHIWLPLPVVNDSLNLPAAQTSVLSPAQSRRLHLRLHRAQRRRALAPVAASHPAAQETQYRVFPARPACPTGSSRAKPLAHLPSSPPAPPANVVRTTDNWPALQGRLGPGS